MLNLLRINLKRWLGAPTFSEMFELYKKEKFPEISKSTQNGYLMAYKHSKRLYDMVFSEIKYADLTMVINDVKTLGHGYSTKKKVKVLFTQMYTYAFVNEYVEKDYARFVKIGRNVPILPRIPFSDLEIKALFDNVGGYQDTDTILIMIFSGIRVGELRNLKKEDVHLSEGYFVVTESKTEAGRNRVIPINQKIRTFIEARMMNESEYLVHNQAGGKISYPSYAARFRKACKGIGTRHYPHDCRHTTATLFSNADANSVSVKRILGHASKDVTEKVYTHKDLRELKKAMDLI